MRVAGFETQSVLFLDISSKGCGFESGSWSRIFHGNAFVYEFPIRQVRAERKIQIRGDALWYTYILDLQVDMA